ncbi:glycosyltransferase [Rhodopila sp.]|uniref:glycosyltransferase n=1 Tax=Rhodopila sp. TaxID=2480087 RepID=UPI002D7EE1A6|nr:glycosyltransferase [Rhodopila sp.]
MDSDIGAVTGLVLLPHGVIGQAGGIIWRDGTCEEDLRGQSPLAPEANFVRSVGFGSPACLLVRAELLARLDGFSTETREPGPACVDLCLRIAGAGARVVYDPAVAVFHDDTADRPGKPDDAFLSRHAEALGQRPVQAGPARAAARQAGTAPQRVLFIEDTVPLRRLGSGFVRANDLVRVMADLDMHVTVFPVNGSTHEIARIYRDMPDTAEVLHDRAADRLKELLLARPGFYDAIWIARTHNLDRVAADLRKWLPEQAARPLVVLDTEAVAPLREAQHAALRGMPFDLEAALRDAFRNADLADVLVTVSDNEARFLRERGYGPVLVAGHMIEPHDAEQGFFQRAGMLFVGAIHTTESPNYDSLVWFVDEVLPRIETVLGWETRLTIVGYTAPDVSLERFRRHPRITLRGEVGNLAPLYNNHRVFIAPTRFAAGTPYKIYEAASWGVPVVATDHLCHAMGWMGGEDIMSAPADPAAFAAAVIALHQHQALWSHVRESARSRLRKENERSGFVAAVRRILGSPRRNDR